MAAWLWVTNLDPKNDWIELKSFSFGGPPLGGTGYGSGKVSYQDIHLTFDPGRFSARFHSWVYKGDQRSVYVFIDPQTEYEFSNAIATSFSYGGNSKIISMSINFDKVTVTHSGAP